MGWVSVRDYLVGNGEKGKYSGLFLESQVIPCPTKTEHKEVTGGDTRMSKVLEKVFLPINSPNRWKHLSKCQNSKRFGFFFKRFLIPL